MKAPPEGSVLSGHLSHLPLKLQHRLRESVQSGALGPADLDPKLVIDLCSMPEEQALVCVERFLNSNLFGIRNKNGFLVGVIKRFKEEMGPNNTRGPVPHTSATVAGYGDHARTIHVGKLDGTVTSEVLAHIFGCIGAILDLRLSNDKTFAFIEFKEATCAEAAVAMAGTDIGGNRITVAMMDKDKVDTEKAAEQQQVAAIHKAADELKDMLPAGITSGLGVVGPTQLTALASITSPAALAALERMGHPAPPQAEPPLDPAPFAHGTVTTLNPAQQRAQVEARHIEKLQTVAWGMSKRRSESDSDASRSRSRSPPRPNDRHRDPRPTRRTSRSRSPRNGAHDSRRRDVPPPPRPASYDRNFDRDFDRDDRRPPPPRDHHHQPRDRDYGYDRPSSLRDVGYDRDRRDARPPRSRDDRRDYDYDRRPPPPRDRYDDRYDDRRPPPRDYEYRGDYHRERYYERPGRPHQQHDEPADDRRPRYYSRSG